MEDPASRQYNELLRDWAEAEYKKLKTSSDDVEVFRAQGALKYLTQLIDLPMEIKAYLHDVSIGTRRKIELKETQHGLARQR